MKEPEPNPNEALQHFFNQVADILSMVQSKKDMPTKELPKDLNERVAFLEKQVEAFKKNSEEILSKTGVTKERLHALTEALPSKERRIIDYAEHLKGELDVIRSENAAKGSIAKKGKKSSGKDKIKERRKKFDQLGGRQDWKPL
jgi:hypothetical protein